MLCNVITYDWFFMKMGGKDDCFHGKFVILDCSFFVILDLCDLGNTKEVQNGEASTLLAS